MSVLVRFAPSPTGYLHVGNVKAALINWLFARKHGGEFLLRLDDTDKERSREDFSAAIEADLFWLGLSWDRFTRQSERLDYYNAAVEELKRQGRLYPCYETAEELERKRRRQLASHRPPVYDRAALRLSAAERAEFEAQGRLPHWRFRLNEGRIEWHDLVRGRVSIDTGSLSDPVLLRADGSPLYTLPSVVDDTELGITHVLRGEDHVANTAVQIQIFEALGYKPPQWGHFALMVDADGGPLSKRAGDLSIAALREQGIEAMAINSLLARLGTSDPVEARASMDALVEGFRLESLGRAAARFDMEELKALNSRVLHILPYSAVRERLRLDEQGEALWLAVRPNVNSLSEVNDWWHVIKGPIEPVITDEALLEVASRLLPPEPWDQGTWRRWTQAIAAETGARGRKLYLPLRLALTGREKGPELQALLPLIGAKRAAARLKGEMA